MFLRSEKCEFHAQNAKYLGLIITPGGIEMDLKKIETVVNGEPLEHLKDVQTFLGFANFYRRFVLGYSSIVAPLTELTKKDVTFRWSELEKKAFQRLKDAFTSAPILGHFNPDKE